MHAVFIDIQNFHLYTFIDLDIRMHIPHEALTDFRNMNQSVVLAVQINKCAVGLDSGIISALIAWKTGCTNGKTLTISYIIYMVLAAFSGTYIPFLFFSKQTLEQYAGMFGESYLGILQTLVSPITAIIMLIVVGLCAFIGAIIAKKLLKKHFQKAGMV